MDGIEAITETAGAAAVELAASALQQRGAKVVSCANCTAPVLGPYCAVCGQPRDVHRRSVMGLAHEFVNEIASFDSRILRTAYALLLRPGELPLAFHEGRTQRYVPPVRLYLFVTLAFFLTLSVTGIAIMQLELVVKSHRYVADKTGHVFEIDKDGTRTAVDGLQADRKGEIFIADDDDEAKPKVAMVDDRAYVSLRGKKARVPIPGMVADGKLHLQISTEQYFFQPVMKNHGGISPQARAVLESQRRRFQSETGKSPVGVWINSHMVRVEDALATNPAAINASLTDWIPRVLFIILPLYALLLAVFYVWQRRKFYFVDHLVFSLNIHTFAFALMLAAAGLAQILPGALVACIWLGVMAIYLLLALKRFYRQGWFWTGTKFVMLSFLYTVFFLIPALIGLLVAGLVTI